jgi:hypothetical protein
MEMEWCCIAAVNDTTVLEANLAASPVFVSDPARLDVLREQTSASTAYNAGLDRSRARICVFAHQDVYLPRGWEKLLAKRVAQLDRLDPDWAVAGLSGIDRDGTFVGRVWSTGLGREFGMPFNEPIPVQSLDELLIVLNRDSGLRFDPDLPSFHLYATDIVQTALSSGKGAYVLDAPVVHNSIPTPGLRGGYMQAYDYMRRKWRARLPIITLVTRITRSGWHLRIRHMRMFWFSTKQRKRMRLAARSLRPDPRSIARTLGYE